MEQPNPNRIPTEEEIARAEAEAVQALLRGKAPEAQPSGEAPADEAARPSEAPAPQPDFVPYVDDVPEAETEAEDDGEYIPSEMEKRIDALSPQRWRLIQIVAGALTGLVAIAALFIGGDELSMYGLIVAALLALILPRYLERAWRRKLTVARRAMLVAMIAALIVVFIVTASRGGLRIEGSVE